MFSIFVPMLTKSNVGFPWAYAQFKVKHKEKFNIEKKMWKNNQTKTSETRVYFCRGSFLYKQNTHTLYVYIRIVRCWARMRNSYANKIYTKHQEYPFYMDGLSGRST